MTPERRALLQYRRDDLVQFKDEEVRLGLEEAQDFVGTLIQIAEEQLRPKEPPSSDED